MLLSILNIYIYIFYGKYMYSWSWYLWKKKKHFFLNNVNWYFLLSIYAKSAALKEAIEDLEWPGSSIKITLEPDPPSVSLRAEGHGDLQVCIVFNSNDQMLVALKFKLIIYTFVFQIDFMYYVNSELLVAFQCDHQASFKYSIFLF